VRRSTPVDAKQRLAQIGAIVALLVGSVGGFALLGGLFRHRPANVWDALDVSFALALAAYLVFVGNRALRWAFGQPAPAAHIKWGRTLFGAWLIFTEVKNHFHPAANFLKPSNEIEAAGMNVAAAIIVAIGVLLIVAGLRSQVRRLFIKQPAK
jgi:hypothetical protein